VQVRIEDKNKNGEGFFVYLMIEAAESLNCVRLLATPWTAAYKAPPSMGFSRQEYWSGVPLPSPDDRGGEAKKYYKDIISCLVFLYCDKYPLPFYEPYGKSDYLQLSLSLIWIACVL